MFSESLAYDFFLVRRAGREEEAVLQMAHLIEVDDLAFRLEAARVVDRFASCRLEHQR